MKSTIAVQGPEGAVALWEPATLRQLGKDEAYLEAALSATPQLLCLESKRTGIYGPFAVFNQVELETPQGRTIYPDIALLAASGDVVIVEVKLFDNPELRDRRCDRPGHRLRLLAVGARRGGDGAPFQRRQGRRLERAGAESLPGRG